MRTKLTGRLSLLFLSFAMVLALPAVALADIVTNNVVAGGNDTITAGGSTTITYQIKNENLNQGDTVNGCNAGSDSPAKVYISAPTGVTLSGADVQTDTNGGKFLQFNGCEPLSKSAQFSSNAAGNYSITHSVSDSGGGRYTTTNANFTLKVNAAAVQKVNTSVSNVSGSGTYGGNANLTAKLASNTGNLEGKTVSFTLNGASVGTDATDANGVAELSGVGLSNINAGTHSGAVNASFAGDSGHNGSSGSGNLTVNKAQASLSLSGLGGHTYTGQPQGATVATSPAGLNGATITYNGNATQPTNAGAYDVVAKLDNPNYQAADATGTMVIAKATPQITWSNPADITFGTQLGAAQLNATADANGSFAYTPGSGTKLDAGDGQDLRADFAPAAPGNYNAASKTVKIDVKKAGQSITFGALADKTYGAPDFAVNASADSGLGVSFGTATPAKCSVNNGSVRVLEAGTCTIEASQNGNANYDAAATVSRSFEIAKKVLTVTANNESKTYGDPNPNFTVRYSDDFVNGDTAASLAGTLSFDTGAAQGSPVGEYGITPKGLTSDNYAIAFENGTLTVNKRAVEVSAADKGKTYGEDDPALTYDITGGSLVGNDNLSGDLTREASQNVGSYAIRQGTLSASGNYDLTFKNGTLTIRKAALSVAAQNASKTYGDENPSFDASYSGFKYEDGPNNLGGALLFDTTATASSPVGSYDVTPRGLTSGNYEITFTKGALAIGKAPLTVEAEGKTREYGQANPGFSVSYSGFKNGEDAGALGGALAFETNASVASAAGGDYYIRPSGLSSGNYEILFVDGRLTIDKAHATIGLGGLSHTYDASAKAATVQVSPEPAAQSATRKALTVTYDGQPARPVNAGSYDVVASLDDDNYVAEGAKGTLVIGKAPLTIKADDQRKIYGDENPSFTGDLTGRKGEDQISASFSSAATAASPVGTYAITSQLEDPDGKLANYSVTREDGTLTVSKAALSAAAGDAIKTYGDENPPLTGTLEGVKNGDPITASYSSAADAGSEVGAYAIVPSINASDDVLANYERPVLTNGTLKVGKAPLGIEADDATRKYGADDPAFSGSVVSGAIKNNDAVSLAFSTPATRTSNVGTYAIVPSLAGAKASNYDLSAQNGTLTITKASARIDLSDLDQVYDGAAKAATVTTTPDVPSKQLTVTYDGGPQAPKNAGSYRVVASLNDANYEAEDATGTLKIDKAQTTLNLGGLSKTYNGSPQGVTVVTNPAGLGGVSITYDGGAQAPTNAGNYSVVAKLDNPNYRAADASGTLSIDKAAARVSLAPASLGHTYDGAVKAARATTDPAGLNVDISYAQNGSAATPRDAGSYDVVATVNDANYRGREIGTMVIGKANQTINFGALGPKTLGDPDFNVNATGGGSGNPVAFAAAGKCTISGNTVRITGVGTCEVTASQAGNVNYNAAGPVKQSFGITYRFAGYRQPVDNNGVFNTAKAGSAIPMKFSLFGNQGLNIFSTTVSPNPKVTKVACTAGATTDAVEEYAATTNSGLTYDATTDQYNYVWKTQSAYAGSCYKFDIVLTDGTHHEAYFKFTK